jgi:DNA repair exonuclease SbcCD nuclease subunit
MAKKTKKRKVAAIFADGHLARRTWKHKPIEGDSYWGFQQICQRAVEEEVEFIIGAGDLIDKRLNEPEPIVFLQKMLKYLEGHGIDFLFVQGQHEMDTHEAWFNMASNAVHLHKKTVNVGEFYVYGLDYTPKDSIVEHALQDQERSLGARASQSFADQSANYPTKTSADTGDQSD